MQNTKIGTTWAPDISPEAIETFTESYTPEGGEEQTVTYKRVADHPILNGIRDKLAFFMTHAGAVWYNKQANRTVKDELEDVNTKMDYSYEERCVGTWIDGKPLYRKMIDFGTLPNATAKAISINVENVSHIHVNIAESMFSTSKSSFTREGAISFIHSYISTVNAGKNDTLGGYVSITTLSNASNFYALVCAEYTKSES